MSLEEVLYLLSDIGLFNKPQEMVMFTDEPKIPSYITAPNERALKQFNCKDAYGQGFHPNGTLAKIKSIGEYLERLSIFNPQKGQLIFSEVDANDIDLVIFNCYSKAQIEDSAEFFKQMRQERYRLWPVLDHLENRELQLPAQLIFLSEIFNDEVPIRKEQITTGTAFGMKNTNEAFLRGFLEVAERDACMISYLRKRRLPEIVGFTGNVQKLLEYLYRYNLETRVYDATTDLDVPTVITITIDRTGLGPSINVGSRSSFDYENAIIGSILESIQCRRATRFMKELSDHFEFPAETEINSMEQRYYYWYSLERLRDLDFWLDSPPKTDFSKLASKSTSLEKVMDNLRSRGYHVFSANITLPEIRHHGFEVVKVLIPELHPLYLDEKCKALYSVHAGEIQDDPSLKPHPFS